MLINKFYSLWRDHKLDPPSALRAAQTWTRNVNTEELRSAIASEFGNSLDLGSSVSDDHPFAAPVHWAGFVYSGV
jgi:CHAT domain-containing protein